MQIALKGIPANVTLVLNYPNLTSSELLRIVF